MRCPLCSKNLKKHLFSSSQAILSCPNEACVYPFNLSMEDIRGQGLIVRTSEQQIMDQMREKMTHANIDPRAVQFMTKLEEETDDVRQRKK